MKKNRYVVKYTVPIKVNPTHIFYSFPEITLSGEYNSKEIFDAICVVAKKDIKLSMNIEVQSRDIDFLMISLVDSSNI